MTTPRPAAPDESLDASAPAPAAGGAGLRWAGALFRVLAFAAGVGALWAAYDRGPRWLLGLLAVPPLRLLGRLLWAAGSNRAPGAGGA